MRHKMILAGLTSLSILALGCGKSEDGKKKDDHGHAHADGKGHDDSAAGGVVARLIGPDGKDAGFIELKLHDDKGDLELWVAKDAKLATPMDLALDTKISVTFTDKEGKTVQLAVRNKDKNEDEDGKANVRDGKTNYFIFPGDSGQDAAWLKGADFLSTVRVTFQSDGKAYVTPNFMLKPHTHGADDGHEH